jgi:TatD DNase family protein
MFIFDRLTGKENVMYIDSHAHLAAEAFAADLPSVLAKAEQAGLERVLVIGCSPPGALDCAILLAERHSWVYATIGIDPHQAKFATNAAMEELGRLAAHPRVIAWGEIGLDYYYDLSPREVQKQCFARQLEFARAAKLPVSIHCRASEGSENAWDDVLQTLRGQWASSGIGGIVHCFTGEWHHARAALDMGFYISFSGILTYPKAQELRETARKIPADRLLIETDCPYLAPVPHRGKRNEPANIIHTAAILGSLSGRSGEETAELTSRNFYELFPGAR